MVRVRPAFIIVALLWVALSCGCGRIGAGVSPPSDTPTATQTITPTPTPTATSTPSPPTPTPTPLPPPATPCPNSAVAIYHGTAKMMMALTFDGESTAGYTQQILDTLQAKGVHATFAVTGNWAQSYPGLLRAIVAGGHQVINHTQDHASFTGRSTKRAALASEQRKWELQTAEEAIKDIAGVSPSPYFRPPYGDLDQSVLCDLAASGYSYVIMWNTDTNGYKKATADQIVATTLAEAKPGGIVVMHVASNSADAAALPRVIDTLRANGYSFGTVDEVLR
jgi:peptidoglycan-N-acetylglucosamine deacetylase